ncbi:hypothetical protein [Haliangium sp. UPWRP_2]|uniref:hypothetical protein n=1 Tax=Haliangium sp. UPWRP_2 TaxID=1931276 RepID=UPI000B542DDA|nr:hypothetical protein [Haliangium sp. UPWRP_2]
MAEVPERKAQPLAQRATTRPGISRSAISRLRGKLKLRLSTGRRGRGARKPLLIAVEKSQLRM